MKTADLTGALLNYWAAMAGEEWKHVDTSDTMTLDPSYKGVRLVTYGDGSQAAILEPNNPMRQDPRVFDPANDWAQGGPIIERLKPTKFYFWEPTGQWVCDSRGPHRWQQGETGLLAAMRCKVASVYGESVPDEVQP